MRIRFGYVAIALEIQEGSPNKTITYANLMKIQQRADRLECLKRLARLNLERLLRVLKYNKHQDIHVYRLTSKLIPLATHPEITSWNYIDDFAAELDEIGAFIRNNHMRVSFHPDHFTLLNSPRPDVIESSLNILTYHISLLEAMRLDSGAKLILHVGGTYRDKKSATARMIDTCAALPSKIKSRIILENDDKSFTAKETLAVCQSLKLPMVADIHHHTCNNTGEPLNTVWPQIMATWHNELPKIHFSSPKNTKQMRAHADFIDADAFYSFLCEVKPYEIDFDVMLEAKQKDRALFQLMRELKQKYSIRFIDSTTIEF